MDATEKWLKLNDLLYDKRREIEYSYLSGRQLRRIRQEKELLRSDVQEFLKLTNNVKLVM